MTKRVNPISSDELQVDFFRGPHATVCHVYVAGDELIGVGDSKRAPGDKASEPVGDMLALGRALRDLADQIATLADAASAVLNPTPPPKPEPLPQVYLVDRSIFDLHHEPFVFSDPNWYTGVKPETVENPFRHLIDYWLGRPKAAKITDVTP
jgi:hypothetical protein